MNNDQLRQNAAAMLAHADGKPTEYHTGDGVWKDTDRGPNWLLETGFQYRPKPEPKVRPWSCPADVPGPVCWIRSSAEHFRILASADKDGIYVAQITDRGTLVLFKWGRFPEFQYSTDRLNWKPRTVTEEA